MNPPLNLPRRAQNPNPQSPTPRLTSWAIALVLLATLAHPQAGTLAQFRTVFGDIELELYDQDKPVTVQNFLRYVQDGGYDGLFVHRLAPGFVVQAGAYFTTNQVDSPVLRVPVYGTITNEYSVGRTFSNTYGTIAMARVGGQTNSATSQWFINLGNNAGLDAVDGGFTVFGRTVAGFQVLETLNAFRSGAGTNGVWDLRNYFQDGAMGEFPLLYASLQYTNLLYVDISLLQVQVTPIPGKRQISWNSVSNRLHRVEYTLSLPPQWQTLVATNGTGNRMTAEDPSPDPRRFYRVRVEY